MLYGRIGLCTQEFGTLASWLVYVINVLTGRLDAEGGAMFGRPATGQFEPTGEVPALQHGRFKSRVRGVPEYMAMLPASCMAEELEWEGEDAVRAMITVAGNPVLSVPNGKRVGSAMDGLEFVVALDIYINETTCRGGRAIVFAEEDPRLLINADGLVRLPRAGALLNPLLATVPLQLLAYKHGVARGYDPDFPRNLSKTLTVD